MINSKKYKNMFRWDGVITCIHSEFFMKGSHGKIDPIIMYDGKVWHTFLNIKKEKECNHAGLRLLSNKNRYKKYSSEFRQYIKDLTYMNKKYRFDNNKKVTITEFRKIIKNIGKLWEYYGYTEYFFTDFAYEKKQKNKLLDNNIKDLNKLKVEGRKALNETIFEKGILVKLLKYIHKTYLQNEFNEKYTKFLYQDDIEKIIMGKKVNKKAIISREEGYGLIKKGDKITKLNQKAVDVLKKSLIRKKGKNTNKILKGKCVYHGKVYGRALIAPMLTTKKDIISLIKKKEKLFKKNEYYILIAHSTSPELITLIDRAKAIVTDQGGMLSHAAVIARERRLPCMVGTNNATKIFEDNELIELDAKKEIVKKYINN
ncbi:MAG: PEP-utilizing enzyme [Candidatus Woesearchaeota archaeon]